MPVVPMTPTPSGAQPQAMPSESNLLMALAEMHKQGRVQQVAAIPDAVYDALSPLTKGGSAQDVHKDMPEGWKANLRTKSGVEVTAPDGKVHFIPNGDF